MGQIVKVYKDGIGYQVLNTDNIGAALEAGDNISIDGNEISAVDTTYSAGTGLSLSGTTFSLNVDYGADLSLSIDPSTFVLTAQLKNQNGGNIGTAQTIDLPLESVVVSGSYNSQTKEVELTLQSGSVIRFSVADLVSGLQEELVVGDGINIDANNEISVDTSVIATKEYVDDSIAESVSAGPTAPLNPTQGMLRYDTVNDVLKSYDGSNWNEVGNESTDINTKAFYLSGTSDLTNAQAAYDWFSAGKNPIVMYNNRAYLLYEKGATQLIFQDIENSAYDQSSYTEYVGQKIIFTLSGNNVTAINYDNTSGWSGPILRTDVNYSTPYTPTYAGSPTTKQYVDDSIAESISSGTTAPSNPTEGQLWYDTTNDVLKVYDGTNWNEVGGDTYTAGTGISIDSNNEISADTSVIATKQYVDDSIAESVSSGPTAPSNPTEGQIWYDTTNDVLKVYDGTNWNEIGSDVYTAGTGIDITNNVISADTTTIATKSDLDEKQDLLTAGDNITIQNECVTEDNKKGPCPSGFHVPTYNECTNLINAGITIGAWASGGGDSFKAKMKMPYSGYRSGPNSANIVNRDYMGFVWTCEGYTIGDPRSAYSLLVGSGNLRVSGDYRQDLLNIRPFKNTGVAPDSSWTTIYDGSSTATGAGIFHNAELGLISISTDGTTWTTIADKNLGATTVYNDGDTLSEANCGKYYQWGNNYGFQWGGNITNVSTTPIDGSSYGPNNYYYNETLVRDTTRTFYDWSTVRNDNVWGGTSQGTFQDCSLTISAADTKYTAGTGISIDSNNVISNTQTSAEWGNITGTLSDQTDLQNALNDKANATDVLEKANTTSYTPTGDYNPATKKYVDDAVSQAGGGDMLATVYDPNNVGADAFDYTNFINTPTAGTGISIDANNVITNTLPGTTSSSTAPSNPSEGDLWYDTTNDVLKVYDGTQWNEVGGEWNLKFFANTTAGLQEMYDWLYNSTGRYGIVQFSEYKHYIFGPTTSTSGRVYSAEGYKTTGLSFNNGNLVRDRQNVYYNLSNGVVTGGLGGVSSGSMIASGIATQSYVNARITSSSTAPSNPTEGQVWYDTTNDVLKVYDGTNWNEVNTDTTYAAGTGLTLNGTTFSADTTVLATKQDIADLGSFEVVASLPSVSSADTKTIYLLGPIGTGVDKYEEWIVTEDSQQQKQWTKIGETSMDLSGYATTSDLTSGLSTKQDTLTASTGINIDSSNNISNTLPGPTIAATAPTGTEGALWYDTTNDVLMAHDGTAWKEAGTQMKVLSYGNSTWQDFIDAYNENAIVYCRASSNTNPATGNQTRMAFMAYVNSATPTEVEFQYYRSRSDHNTAANQLDQVFVYKLTSASGGTWTVTERNTGAKAVAGTGISLAFGSGNMTISADTTVLATQTDLNSKQDTLVSGTNIKTVNSNSLLGSGDIILNDVKTSSTAPSSPTEGMVWYDTTNDQLKVYDGTNWNVTGKEYNAGPGIQIGTIQDYSAMRGPCPDGFHVPTKDECISLCGILTTTFGLSNNGGTLKTYLKMPFAGYRNTSGSGTMDQGTQGTYRASQVNPNDDEDYEAYAIYINSNSLYPALGGNRGSGFTIRAFKDTPVVPDSSWTTLYQGTSNAGIFHNSTLSLISISGDGVTWTTIADKNLGATTVYNDGDTLSEANCGKYYQRGNNYGFPFTGSVTTSSTKVDASAYGPGNYYSSNTFITNSIWDSSLNNNLRGGEAGVVTLDNAITNTGVLSVNGQTGDVTIADIYSDYAWVAKSGTNIELSINSTLTPTADFTINAPAQIKDGQIYILRITSGGALYNMSLGTNITNPFATDLTLTRNGIDQFVFMAIGGNLELQPEAS